MPNPVKALSLTSAAWRWGSTWVPPTLWSLHCVAAAASPCPTRSNVILPSAVRYLDGRIEVGQAARDAASSDPLNTVLSVKRLMGRGLADVKQLGEQLPYRFVGGESHMPFIDTVQGPKSPVEVSADILKVLRERAEATLGGELVAR